MKTREEVSHNKLRGGFYTPDGLVDICLDRIATLTAGRPSLRVLEPSVGDGAFIRGFARSSTLRARVNQLTALELLPSEAAKSANELADAELPGTVQTTSGIEWAATTESEFDVAVGNPPFVRFQFVTDSDREFAEQLARRLGLSFAGVSNLWLPVLLGALSRLRIGGVFAFVVPAECFTGISAGVVREWLVRSTQTLRFDLFPPGSFPSVLQEVIVVSGRRRKTTAAPNTCTISEHPNKGRPTSLVHSVTTGREPWTKYLLDRRQLEAVEEAASLEVVTKLGLLAKFEVAAVTGANDYFSVDTRTLNRFELQPWSVPLLPRIRHAPGLRYTSHDHASADLAGARVHLLDFADHRPDPEQFPRSAAYLRIGEEDGLDLRYKCRIRTPWYRVPWVRPGELMLSKRSHWYPRVVLNETGVVTTDTIYRGAVGRLLGGHPEDLVASFHNSLTLLSAELQGRSFGGGVLELVPSEISRLLVPHIPGLREQLDWLDRVARAEGESQALVDQTDLLLTKTDLGLTQNLLTILREARLNLLRRRLDRSGGAERARLLDQSD